MELDYKDIGLRIRQRRKSLHYTQQQLAELSDQEPSNVSHIERGATKLSLPTLVSIANALGVSADELLCGSIQSSKPAFDREVTNSGGLHTRGTEEYAAYRCFYELNTIRGRQRRPRKILCKRQRMTV